MGSRDPEDRNTPGGGLESADTQHDPATEIAVARTMESADFTPGGTEVTTVGRSGDLPPGFMVGEYRVEGKLGAGGMGVVFAATHPLIGKKAAIKVLKPEMCASAAGVERFIQEARAVNQIGHPNIVDIFSFGTLPDGRSYFVMEWLRGESLQARLKRQPLTATESLDVLEAVCAALAAAHDKGIVHRDLKPENVFMVEVKGEAPQVKLLDFGIAKLTGSEDTRMEKTATGHLLGTPLYISPEQARGQMVDARADIYSLGAMAFEMLCGRPPFVGESAMDVIARHLTDPPPRLLALAPRLPASLGKLVGRMLEKERGDRPDLAEVRAGFIAARAEALAMEGEGARGRGKRVAWIAGVVVLAAVIGVGAWWGLGRGAEGEGDGSRGQGGGVQQAAAVPAKIEPKIEPTVEPKAVPKPAGGLLQLHVKTAGATVEVDGKRVAGPGTTSPSVSFEKPGKHRVRATARGFKPYSKDVWLAAEETLELDVTLVAVRGGKPGGTRPPVDEDATVDPFGAKPAPKSTPK